MDNTIDKALSWDDEISLESEFELLPAGEYDFYVDSIEKGHFGGSEKMSPCPQASLTIIVKKADGKETKIFDTLYLNTKAEWKLSQFFIAIGQKKKGEPFRMNGAKVPGAHGRLSLVINEYKDKNGNLKKNNRVEKYLVPEKKEFTAGQF